MKPVFLIVIMSSSSREFHEVRPEYIHRQVVSYSSGVGIGTLEHVTYISLDNFAERTDNKMKSDLDAWLTFFTAEEPEQIMKLLSIHPEFLPMYQDIAEFRKNPGEVVGMFSEALHIMDRNTTRYMIDEMQQTIKDLQKDLQQTHNDDINKLADHFITQTPSLSPERAREMAEAVLK